VLIVVAGPLLVPVVAMFSNSHYNAPRATADTLPCVDVWVHVTQPPPGARVCPPDTTTTSITTTTTLP
jgi:hypothetical protein